MLTPACKIMQAAAARVKKAADAAANAAEKKAAKAAEVSQTTHFNRPGDKRNRVFSIKST